MTSGLTSFTTTHRVIMGVHNYTTVVRTTSQPTRTSGLTRTFQRMIAVTNTTYSSLASTENQTSLARRQLDNTVTAITRSQLSKISSGAYQQSALSGTQFDIVDYSTHRNVLQRQTVTYFGGCFGTTHHSGTHLQTVGSNNITFFTVSVIQQSDTSRTVRIVLDCLYNCGYTIFLSLEVDETEKLLMATSKVTHSHLSIVVTTTSRTLSTNERLLRYRCSNLFEGTYNFVSLARCCGLKFTYCHLLFKCCYKNQ